MPWYKMGKQKDIMSVEEFRKRLEGCNNWGPRELEKKAFLVLLWHTGVRKSEALERVKDDVKITETHVIVDFHKRKKGGLEVPPLKIPRSFYGVNEYLVPYLEKPKRFRLRRMEVDKVKKGVRTYSSSKVEAQWLFSIDGGTTAWRLVKKVLGPEYYPHYLRLRKLSKIGMHREKGTLVHLRSFSGIKTLGALAAYMAIDEEAQDEAMSISE